MVGVEHGTNGVRQGMHAAQPFLECGGAHYRGGQHLRARFDIAAIGHGARQEVVHQLHAFQRHALCQWVVKR